MKKFLLVVFFVIGVDLEAQLIRRSDFLADPTGACQNNILAINAASKTPFLCMDGWKQIGATGGGGGLTGSGTTNTISKFTGASALGNSQITDTGSLITIPGAVTLSGNAQFADKLFQIATATIFSATPTFNAEIQNHFVITLTGNVTSSTLSGTVTAGYTELITFVICQDATGSRTFIWPTNIKGAMTIGSTLSTCSAQEFRYDGTNAYALSSGVTGM